MSSFDLAASAGHMHLRLADFQVGKLGCYLFQDRVIELAGFARRQTVCHNGGRRLGELCIVGIADVENGAHGMKVPYFSRGIESRVPSTEWESRTSQLSTQ